MGMSNNQKNWSSFFFWLAVAAEPDERKRKQMLTCYFAILLLVPLLVTVFVLIWASSPHYDGTVWVQSEPYAVTGTRNRPLWKLKEEDFIAQLNEKLGSDSPEFTYADDNDPAADYHHLENKEHTVTVSLRVFSSKEASGWYKDEPESAQWVGNVGQVMLCFPSVKSEEDMEQLERYAKCVIGIFSPEKENNVAKKLGFESFPLPSKDRTVKAGNILYTYERVISGKYNYENVPFFYVEPQ